MLQKTCLFLVLAAGFLHTNAEWRNCDGATTLGSVVSVEVSDCDKDDARCVLKRNHNATISISFTTTTSSDQLKAVVHGLIMSVPVPFDLPNADGCKDSGVTCPIGPGQTYNYKATLPVLQRYPRITVDVKWELRDKDNKDIVCIEIPAKIK